MKRTIFWLVVAVAACGLAAAVKVSELPSASSVSLSDVVPLVSGGQTKKATVAKLADAVVGRDNDYTGTFTGTSLTVNDGFTPPDYGPAVAIFGSSTSYGLHTHSEQSNAILATSRNGQAGKFVQIGWDGETYNTPVVRVARGIGSSGVNHSPLLTLETTSSAWSDGDAILIRRDGVDTFRVTADGVVRAAGSVLTQTSDIPTNAIPAGSDSITNWALVNLGGIPTFIATNHAAGGWLQKPMWP